MARAVYREPCERLPATHDAHRDPPRVARGERAVFACDRHRERGEPPLDRGARLAAGDDERGRGLQIVSRMSARWGARRTVTGKVVWCEQAFPRA